MRISILVVIILLIMTGVVPLFSWEAPPSNCNVVSLFDSGEGSAMLNYTIVPQGTPTQIKGRKN